MTQTIKIDPSNFRGPDAEEQRRQAGQQASTAASTTSSQTSAARGQADLPFIAPKAKTDLTDAQLKVLRDMQSNARDELKTFRGLEPVKVYEEGMRYFSTALTVPTGSAGDQDLVTLAAKVQDPTGNVMEGDVNRYNNIQVALERLPQAFRNEFDKTGKFTPETRKNIIAFMRNRVDTSRAPYEDIRQSFEARIGDFNKQLTPLGVTPIELNKIIGADPFELYAPKIAAYDKKLEADAIRAEREVGEPTKRADVFQGLPEGTQIAGRDVTGWRFTPESEAEIRAYAKSKTGTAEGYAKLIAQKATEEGHVPPSQQADYEQRTLNDARTFFDLPPETRARASGVDYSQIDKAASENAGLFEGIAQTVANVPESAAQLAEGVVAIPRDVLGSALTGERRGVVKTFTDLAMELGQGQLEGPTVQAFANAMADRYGSVDAMQRTFIKDPLGVAGDVSMLATAGGSAAARLPGKLGAAGEAVAKLGRAVDPLSGAVALTTEAPGILYGKAKAAKPGAVEGIENIPSELVGLPSGIGGQAVREATGAGFERGVTGAPTPRSEAFTEGMRRPGESAESIVDTARAAIANLRDQAGAQYRQAMQQFGQQPVPLDISNVQKRIAGIKPRNYDAMVGASRRPSDHVAWEQMNETVRHYADQAVKDPSLLEPMAMDAFKQDLYDIGSKIGGAYDRDAARIAKTAYTAVRQELVKHDPVYADIMKNYEKAAVEARELEDMFSLGQARGKPVKVDTAARKLQSIMRNNANTNYGMRAERGERLAELDPTGTLMAANAGQMASAPTARGITRGVVAGGGVPAAGVAALVNPASLVASAPLLAATSPRLTGELAYGAGRLAGTAKRAFDTTAGSPLGQGAASTAAAMRDLYQKYPTSFLAAEQAATRLEETEAEKRRKLLERYNLPLPGLPPELSSYLTGE